MSYIYHNQNNHYLRKQSYNQTRNHAYHNNKIYQSRYKQGTTNGGYNERRSTTLYMGDLDTTWDESTINNIWRSIGINYINIKMLWQPSMGNNRLNQGYCFIEFESNKEASQVLLKYNGTSIPGFPNKFFKLNWSNNINNNSYNNNNNNNDKRNEATSLFVGDLASSVTESQLFELFSNRYKSTMNAKVMVDLNTGLSKGYGFVKFSDPTDQQNALVEMQGVYLNGRAIKLGQGNNNNNNNNNSNAIISNITTTNTTTTTTTTTPVQLPKTQFSIANQHIPQINHFTDPNNTTVFIGGLSSSVTEEELKSIFEPFGPMIYINIPKGKNCGFIQFVDRESGESAINNMQGFPIGNSRIRLSWGRSFKQYNNITSTTPTTNSNNNKKNLYLSQPFIPNPIYNNHFAHLRNYNNNNYYNTNVNNTNKSDDILEYLPGFQDNYFNNENILTYNNVNNKNDNNNNNNNIHSFDRLENRSNRYL